MYRRLLPLVGCLVVFTGANAQQTPPAPLQPVAGALFSQGFEVKGIVNNTFLIMQKGDKAYWCGSADPGLTWANWPQMTREAPCVPLTK